MIKTAYSKTPFLPIPKSSNVSPMKMTLNTKKSNKKGTKSANRLNKHKDSFANLEIKFQKEIRMPLILSSRGKKEETKEPKKQSRAYKTMFGTFAAKSPYYKKDRQFQKEVNDRAKKTIMMCDSMKQLKSVTMFDRPVPKGSRNTWSVMSQ